MLYLVVFLDLLEVLFNNLVLRLALLLLFFPFEGQLLYCTLVTFKFLVLVPILVQQLSDFVEQILRRQ